MPYLAPSLLDWCAVPGFSSCPLGLVHLGLNQKLILQTHVNRPQNVIKHCLKLYNLAVYLNNANEKIGIPGWRLCNFLK